MLSVLKLKLYQAFKFQDSDSLFRRYKMRYNFTEQQLSNFMSDLFGPYLKNEHKLALHIELYN